MVACYWAVMWQQIQSGYGLSEGLERISFDAKAEAGFWLYLHPIYRLH